MNPILLPGHADLIEALVPLLEGVSRDYSANLVIFPGKRPAHFLRKALARKTGGSLIPPATLSMDEFVDWVYDQEKSRPRKRLEALDAVAILYELHSPSGVTHGP